MKQSIICSCRAWVAGWCLDQLTGAEKSRGFGDGGCCEGGRWVFWQAGEPEPNIGLDPARRRSLIK